MKFHMKKIFEYLSVNTVSASTIVAKDNNIYSLVRKEIKEHGEHANLNHIDVSEVTNMENLFYETDFQGTISKWNVSKVENMNCMFKGCKYFDNDLQEWDVSNVKTMREMFDGCESFNGNISSWNVENVEHMDSMFLGCKNFNRYIGDWNVSNVVSMNHMFQDCESFNQDLSKWNVDKCLSFEAMFYKCKEFNCDLSSWNLFDSKRTKILHGMFYKCKKLDFDMKKMPGIDDHYFDKDNYFIAYAGFTKKHLPERMRSWVNPGWSKR